MENQIVSGASFHRGKSKQDYKTPDDFREAVSEKFGCPSFDLAADEDNAFCTHRGMRQFFTVEDDSLNQDWIARATPLYQPDNKLLLWLNPPFGSIAPWAKKCADARWACHILFLVPASVGSNWWAEYVHNLAFVHFLRPRICFDSKDPLPKDCALCEYGTARVGYDLWKWK